MQHSIFWSLIVLAAAAVPAAGQTPASGQAAAAYTQPVEVPERVGIGVTQTPMTLQEAVETAVRNNLEVEIVRTNVATAAQAIRAAQGAFDPVLRLRPVWESATTPASSVLQAADGRLVQRSWAESLSLVQPLSAFGTSVSANFNSARTITNNPFTNLNPFLTSQLTFGIAQPLLRGFRTDPLRTQVSVRRREAAISENEFRLAMIDVIGRVEQAYWDLVAARQDVAVQQESAELARRQLEINRRFIEAGTLAPVELSASEAELQRRLDNLHTSVGNLSAAENRLKSLLTPNAQDPLWSEAILPIDANRPSTLPPVVDLAELIGQARKQRLELETVRQRTDIAELQRRLASNQRLPQVDVIAAYGNSGLAGTAQQQTSNPFTSLNSLIVQRLNALSATQGLQPIQLPSFGGGMPADLIGGYSTSLSNLLSGRYQTFQVGLNIDFNLRNRIAEANLAQAEIAQRRLGLERARIEQAIQVQVRDAVQGIQTARQRVAAAAASTRAAREKLDSETRLFQSGESTNFLVLTRQTEYANSRLREVLANLELNRSASRLEQALGSTLGTYSVQFQ